MADNVPITPGLGKIIATDEVIDGTLGTVQVQFVKIMDGTLDGTSKAAVGTNGLKTDGSGVTQPISAASLPLPTNASTSIIQTDGTQKTQIVDESGNAISSTSNALDINIKSGVTLEVDLDNANDDVLIYGFDGSANQKIKTDIDGSISINDNAGSITIDASSLPLPTGAATSSLQTTGNSSLSSIDTKLTTTNSSLSSIDAGIPTALGQTTMAASMPVTLASNQSALDIAITGTVPLPTGAATAALQTQPGVDIGDVTINNAAGASAVNIQDGGNSLTVDGTIAATQSGTWDINNISGTISLPTGAATETTLGTRLADATFTTRINTLGQKTMANSMPVVIASDQSSVPVTISTLSTSAVTRVASSTSSQQLLASNANRKLAVFYNDSTGIQYIKFGTTSSSTDFTVRMTSQSYYEVPSPVYTGRIDCISGNTNGGIQVTELT